MLPLTKCLRNPPFISKREQGNLTSILPQEVSYFHLKHASWPLWILSFPSLGPLTYWGHINTPSFNYHPLSSRFQICPFLIFKLHLVLGYVTTTFPFECFHATTNSLPFYPTQLSLTPHFFTGSEPTWNLSPPTYPVTKSLHVPC